MRILKMTALLLIVFYQWAYAQVYRGQHELSLSYGMVSTQQINNSSIGFGGGSGGTYITDNTGSGLLTYRYAISGCIAIGIGAGIQQFFTTTDDYGTVIRKSSYTYTTIAPEFRYNYKNRKNFRKYTYVSLGLSFVANKFNEYYYQGSDSHSGHLTTFNMQLVPFGISVGDKFAGFLELGVGYKGLLNLGISYRFGAYKQIPLSSGKGISKDLIILPSNYNPDTSWQYRGKVKSGPPENRDLSLEHQLYRISANAIADSANILKITTKHRWNCNGCYQVKGKVWFTNNPDSLRKAIDNVKLQEQKFSENAYLVIYVTQPFTASTQYKQDLEKLSGELTINDTLIFSVTNNNKYVFRITREGDYKVDNNNGKAINISVMRGHTYYINASVGQKRVRIQSVSTGFGEEESKSIKKEQDFEIK